MSKRLDVGPGLYALVDDDDWKRASTFTWRLQDDGYVMRTWNDGLRTRHELLHRFVMKAKPHEDVVHMGSDRSDCRKEGLRKATAQETCFRRRPREGKKYKGAYRFRDKWKARIKKDGVNFYLGCFPTEEAAAKAYDKAAIEIFGPLARLNFPLTLR